MKVLWIKKFLPMPADSGGKQRSLAVLRHLTKVADVTLCAFDDGHSDIEGLRALGVEVRAVPRPGLLGSLAGVARTGSLSAGRFWSNELLAQARSSAASSPPDVLLVTYSQLAPYGAKIPAPRRILELQNVESALFASYAASSGRRLTRLTAAYEQHAMRRIERRAGGEFDTVVVVTEQDAERLPFRPRRLLVCENGMDPSEALPMGDEPIVSFVALLGWAPNVDAALWLTSKVWPRVREAVPGARLLLVGREPAAAVRALASDDITVTGTVPDVRPYLERTRVAVAPLLAGGGSRLKIMEALNAGRPVVATSVGAEGLEDLKGDGLDVEDDPTAFADAVIAHLRDRAGAVAAGLRGNAAVRERHGWDRTLAPLINELTSDDDGGAIRASG